MGQQAEGINGLMGWYTGQQPYTGQQAKHNLYKHLFSDCVHLHGPLKAAEKK